MAWTDVGWDKREKSGRIASYIRVYNKEHEDDRRLALWPEKHPGNMRAGRYAKVIYIGNEQVKTQNHA